MTEHVRIHLQHIPETRVVPGRRLGRHIHHDSRSLAYQVEADGTVASASWARLIPILDQGEVGSCTGNATVGHLGTTPEDEALSSLLASGALKLNEAEALVIYSDAEVIDGDGPYPPNDNGSSGLSVAKAAQARGLISGYKHMTSLAACQTAIQTGPFIVGSNWYDGMDSPDSSGLVEPSGDVRGGHEYECIGYDASTDRWHLANSWGTSYGVEGYFFYTSATLTKLLSEDGDATQFVPLSAPAPVPNPPTPTPFPPTPPVPPTPVPGPTPVAVVAFLGEVPAGWEDLRHVGANEKVAKAVQALRVAYDLPASPRHGV